MIVRPRVVAFAVLFLVVSALVALTFMAKTPAKVAPPAATRFYNDDRASTQVDVVFRTSWGSTSVIGVRGGTWQGQGNGNMAYLPVGFSVPPGNCVDWYVQDDPGGRTDCGGARGRYVPLPSSDKATTDQLIRAARVYYRGY